MAVPVTHALYERFDPGHRALRDDFGGKVPVAEQDDHPVYNVTWYEATLFAEWVGGRLPWEAEWEYACRAGTTTAYESGRTEEDLARVGWYENNSGGHTHPVGQLPHNLWHLHDLHGNVDEWCLDPWVGSYPGREAGVIIDQARSVDPGDLVGRRADRVVRGGCWRNLARWARAACRRSGIPVYQSRARGFRVLLPPPQLLAVDPRS